MRNLIISLDLLPAIYVTQTHQKEIAYKIEGSECSHRAKNTPHRTHVNDFWRPCDSHSSMFILFNQELSPRFHKKSEENHFRGKNQAEEKLRWHLIPSGRLLEGRHLFRSKRTFFGVHNMETSQKENISCCSLGTLRISGVQG